MDDENFHKLNQIILKFIKKLKIDSQKLKDKNFKLPVSDAIFCIDDIKRNFYFFKAIEKSINKLWKKNISMLDIWCWTWILWIFWIFLWVKKCIFVDHNPYSLEICKKLIDFFWYSKNCEFMNFDATKVGLDKSFDILVSETLESTLSEEDFPKIINQYNKKIKKYWIIIPENIKLSINQYNNIWNLIKKDIIDYSSYLWFKKIDILLEKQFYKLYCELEICFFDDIIWKSWDFSLFINKKIRNIEKQHNLINFLN